MIQKPTILSLYDRSGVWSDPYRYAGCYVLKIDKVFGIDTRLIKYGLGDIYGILAAPPCSHFAVSGARWWKDKGEEVLYEALSLVDVVFRMVVLYKPVFWCIENPVGRLVHYIGPPRMTFNPCAFGDPYTKKTLLWGKFRKPKIRLVEPTNGSKINKLGSKDFRRSRTPEGFARAFFEANKPRFKRI